MLKGFHFIFYVIQVLWTNIKKNLKKTVAETWRERFKTAEGPANKDTEQLSELLTGIIENQQPLANISYNGHLDSSDEGSSTPDLSILVHWFSYSLISDYCFSSTGVSFNVFIWSYEPFLCVGGSEMDRTAELQGIASSEAMMCASTAHRNRRLTMNEKLAIEFH